MGSIFLKKYLDNNDFLNKHLHKDITTVFPATTVAATTSMMTGLNPSETAMLGWNMYYKDLDKIITTFRNTIKNTNILSEDAINYKNKYMITKTIMDEINEKGKYKGYTLFPFGDNPYKDRNDLCNIIENLCNNNDKKYIYAYDVEPDNTMHDFGCDAECIKKDIKEINNLVEKLSKKLKDTIIFVLADHGHINVENIFINDYKDIMECLKQDTSLEQRTINFHIKEDKIELFKDLFNKYFSDYFDLYTVNEVIESKLFGDGEENIIFKDILGDYIAIAKSNKALVSKGEYELVSTHAGYTNDEIMVPLIIIDTDKL